MIYPSVDELTQNNKYNRYTLVIAVAKCARMVTDEYVNQRENAERMLANKETDKSLASLIKKDFRDEKAVRIGTVSYTHLDVYKRQSPGPPLTV